MRYIPYIRDLGNDIQIRLKKFSSVRLGLAYNEENLVVELLFCNVNSLNKFENLNQSINRLYIVPPFFICHLSPEI